MLLKKQLPRQKFRIASFIPVLGLAVTLVAAQLAPAVPTVEAAPVSAGQAANDIKLVLNGNEFVPQSALFNQQGVLYIPLRDIGEMLGVVVYWNASTKTVTMTYPELLVTLKLGASEAVINGKTRTISSPLKLRNNRVYVPLRFFSEAIGARTEWKAPTKTVTIAQATTYDKGIGVNVSLWLNRDTGALYIAHPFEAKPVAVGKLNASIYEYVDFDVQLLNSGGMMIAITDNYGEPHINFSVYTAYIKNNSIVNQTKVHYYQRYEKNVLSYNDLPVLTDGKMLTLLNSAGNVTQEYDLTALAGKDETYAVLGIGQSYLIVRPNRTGFLTLINLKDNSATLLYQKLLSDKQEREYTVTNDTPYPGDGLMFTGEASDGTLTFSYHSFFDGKDHEITYKINE